MKNKLYIIYYIFDGTLWKTWILNNCASSKEIGGLDTYIESYEDFTNLTEYSIKYNVRYEINFFLDKTCNYLLYDKQGIYEETSKQEIKQKFKLDKFNKSFIQKIES